jgi:Cdc6-like AAA superfamily ATPase
VKEGLDDCANGVDNLEKKLEKLRTHPAPIGFRQKAWAEVQRLYYPFRESTLAKLREIVGDLRGRLALALQVLQFDLSIGSFTQIGADVKDTAANIQCLLTAQQADQFRKIVDWLSPPDPWTNHESACRRHEPDTGQWLLKSEQYCRWKAGLRRHLWMHGKAGCGKTVLCYTVIEDIRSRCESSVNAGFAVFYFTFSDKQKQSYQSLLLSLVAQLGWREPAQSILRQTFESPNKSVPSSETLEKILVSSIRQYDEVSVLLDALDECPEDDDARQDVLDLLQRLARSANDLRIFTTSRQLPDIKFSMEDLNSVPMSVDTIAVDVDIGRYIRNELSRDRRLNRLSDATKTLITETVTQKADGM